MTSDGGKDKVETRGRRRHESSDRPPFGRRALQTERRTVFAIQNTLDKEFGMTWLEAVAQVLAKAGEPLHYAEITDRILGDGLKEAEGSNQGRPRRLRQTVRGVHPELTGGRGNLRRQGGVYRTAAVTAYPGPAGGTMECVFVVRHTPSRGR